MERARLLCLVVLVLAGLTLSACLDFSGHDRPVWVALDKNQPGFFELTRAAGTTAEEKIDLPQATLLRMRERDLSALSKTAHDTLPHCGGFLGFADKDDALIAIKKPNLDDIPIPDLQYALDDSAVVQKLIPRLNAKELYKTIKLLSSFPSRYYDSHSGEEAAYELAELWESYIAHRDDASVELWRHDWIQPSVILTVTGKTHPEEIVIVGGHLDSIAYGSEQAPGADDNASGIATLTEAARVLLTSGHEPDRTVEFIAYAAEEVGLRGSGDIAKAYQKAGKQVVGVLQLDMVNFRGSQRDIYLIDDHTSAEQNQFLATLIEGYLPNLTWGWSSCGYACSDHYRWTAAGYRASTPFEASLAGSNDHIHTPKDTLSVSSNNALHAAKFGRLTLAYVGELAGGELNLAKRAIRVGIPSDWFLDSVSTEDEISP